MKSLSDDDETVLDVAKKSNVSQVQPLWMRQLQQSCENFLLTLPQVRSTPFTSLDCINLPFVRIQTLSAPALSAMPLHDPLYRFFTREVAVGRKLLTTIRQDLKLTIDACNGGRQTNHVRSLVNSLTKGKSVLSSFCLFDCLAARAFRHHSCPLARLQVQTGSSDGAIRRRPRRAHCATGGDRCQPVCERVLGGRFRVSVGIFHCCALFRHASRSRHMY
jgi:Dynein heavy chain C-terminal domain